jgi:hypothetical protein
LKKKPLRTTDDLDEMIDDIMSLIDCHIKQIKEQQMEKIKTGTDLSYEDMTSLTLLLRNLVQVKRYVVDADGNNSTHKYPMLSQDEINERITRLSKLKGEGQDD